MTVSVNSTANITIKVRKEDGRITVTDPVTVKNQIAQVPNIADIGDVRVVNLTDGAILRYNANTQTYDVAPANTLFISQLTANLISTNSLTASQLSANLISSTSLSSNAIAADTLSADQLSANAIASNTFSTDQLSANGIVSNTLSADQLSANVILSNTLSSNAIASNTLSTDKLSANVISSNLLSADQLSANSGAVGSLTLTDPLAAIYGGTGIGLYAAGDLLYAANATHLMKLAIGDHDTILTVNNGVLEYSNVIDGGFYGL